MTDKVLKGVTTSRPIRMWIDGKCLTLKQCKNTKLQKKIPSSPNRDPGPIYQNSNAIEFNSGDDGKLFTSFGLPSIYYIKLNQRQIIDLENLSQETRTNISIPKHGSEGRLTIYGEKKENICLVLDQIYSALGQIRQQSVALQFIGIPLLSDEIRNNFVKFRDRVLLEKDKIQGMHESIFQKANKLHLTVDVCVLFDEKEKQEAISALNEYRDSLIKPLLEKKGPLTIQVSGIDCMNGDYKKANVLYANAKLVEEDEKLSLQEIVNNLSNHFYEKGLLKEFQENVKVHMTLLNTKYRSTGSSSAGSSQRSHKRRWSSRQPFDASIIMEKYKDFNFGTCKLNNIRLSIMSSVSEDGFYKSLAEINF